jgi:hypothetical protein
VLTSYLGQFDTDDKFESILDIIQSKMVVRSAPDGDAGLFMPNLVANALGSVVAVKDWATCRILSKIQQCEWQSKEQTWSQGSQQHFLTFIWVNLDRLYSRI